MASETCRECDAEVRCGECGAEEPGYRPPAVPDPTVEALSEAEREWLALGIHYARRCNCDSGAGDRMVADELASTVEAILTARAATPDALRVAVEALAAEWERTDWNATPHLGCLDMYRHCGGLLRALLDDPALAGRATGGEG